MRPYIRNFSIPLVTCYFVGAIAYAVAAHAESRTEAHEGGPNEKVEAAARERLKEMGVSDKALKEAKRKFEPPKPPRRANSPTSSHRAGGTFEPSAVARDKSGKIDLPDKSKATQPSNFSGNEGELRSKVSPPNGPAQSHTPQDQQPADDEAAGKSEAGNAPNEEQHHTHSHHPEDPCDHASSPPAVEACKKSRDESQRPK
jgi:hypothetical protein